MRAINSKFRVEGMGPTEIFCDSNAMRSINSKFRSGGVRSRGMGSREVGEEDSLGEVFAVEDVADTGVVEDCAEGFGDQWGDRQDFNPIQPVLGWQRQRVSEHDP